VRDLKLLVTGVGGAAVGNQILKALQLAERKYRVVVGDASPDSLKLSRIEPAYLLPPASDPGYLDEVIRVCRQEEIGIVVPGSEPELKLLVGFREHLRGMGIHLLTNEARVIDLCMDKMATCQFLESHGFRVPRSLLIEKEADVKMPADFPLVLKPARDSGGSKNVFIVQQEDELLFFSRYLLRHTDAVLIQEYVGTPGEEYTVGVLTDWKGELIGSIALRRYISDGLSTRLRAPNRTGRAELGRTLVISSGFSHGIIQDFQLIREQCERLATALGSRGPLNVQCRMVEGEIVPFEINPRFSGTASIRALMGFNEPDMLLRKEFLGETLPPPQFRTGVILRSLKENCLEIEDAPLNYQLQEQQKTGGKTL
jgi:carbamoyl-phosphate synthase large subunit